MDKNSSDERSICKRNVITMAERYAQVLISDIQLLPRIDNYWFDGDQLPT